MQPVPIRQLWVELRPRQPRRSTKAGWLPRALLILAVAAITPACRRTESTGKLSNEIIATVAGHVITAGEYQQRLAALGSAASQPEARVKVLQEMIETEALAQQAKREGWEQKPEIQRQIRNLLATHILEDQLAQVNRLEPSEAEIQGYYESNLVRFSTAEQVRGAVLQLKLPFKCSPEKERELLARAATMREAVTNAKGAADFGSVALEFSEDQTTRYRGGDLGYLTAKELEKRLGPEAGAALLSLQTPGDVSPVIKAPSSLYVLKLLGRQPGTSRPLAELRSGIVYLLRQEKESATRKQLASACTNSLVIHINHALLTAQPPAVAPEPVPGLPAITTVSSH